MKTAELLIDSKCILGEGSWFDIKTGTLTWLDIFGCKIYQLDARTQMSQSWQVSKPATTIVAAESGGYILGMIDGIYKIDDKFTDLQRLLPEPDEDFSSHRCNDGKCDPQGRFWIGVMELAGKKGAGSLYRYDGRSCTRILGDLDIPNGIVWNSKGDTVYFTDTLSAEIYAFDFAGGEITNRRTVFKADQGMTDGMAIDEEDMVWVAVWGAGQVLRVDPARGRVIDSIAVGAPQASSVAIAGGKIYITTATVGMSAAELQKYPEAGGLFIAATDLQGVASPRFR